MEYTIQQAKDEAVKYCTKDFPVYTYEYDGAGGSMCYIRKDIAEKMAELYASKLREADRKRIEELERGIECFNQSESNLRSYIGSLNKTLIDIYHESTSPENDSPSIEYIIAKCKKALNP